MWFTRSRPRYANEASLLAWTRLLSRELLQIMSDGHKFLGRNSGKRYVHVLRVTRVGHYLKPLHDHKSRFRHRNCHNWGKSEVSLMRWWPRHVLVNVHFGPISDLWVFSSFLRLCSTSGNSVVFRSSWQPRWKQDRPVFTRSGSVYASFRSAFLRRCVWEREYSSQPRCHAGSQGSCSGQYIISVTCYHLVVSYLRPHTRYSAKPLTHTSTYPFMRTWSKQVSSVAEFTPGLCLTINVIRLTADISF